MTMAVFAALLAVSTMLGHRQHTEEVLLQTQATDDWGFYQAKNGRAQMYEANARLASLSGSAGASLASSFMDRSKKESADAARIRGIAEHREEETRSAARRAYFFDASEIFLEIAIVLCSVALLAGALVFWRVSFLGAVAGVALCVYGFLI